MSSNRHDRVESLESESPSLFSSRSGGFRSLRGGVPERRKLAAADSAVEEVEPGEDLSKKRARAAEASSFIFDLLLGWIFRL